MAVTKLHRLLDDAQLPQTFLVDQLGIGKSHVSEYVNGKLELPVKHVMTLCYVFSCNPDDIMGWYDDSVG